MLNETGLRFSDEFVRHKILDIIGDLALLGMPILGKVKAERSGHIMHAGLMAKLFDPGPKGLPIVPLFASSVLARVGSLLCGAISRLGRQSRILRCAPNRHHALRPNCGRSRAVHRLHAGASRAQARVRRRARIDCPRRRSGVPARRHPSRRPRRSRRSARGRSLARRCQGRLRCLGAGRGLCVLAPGRRAGLPCPLAISRRGGRAVDGGAGSRAAPRGARGARVCLVAARRARICGQGRPGHRREDGRALRAAGDLLVPGRQARGGAYVRGIGRDALDHRSALGDGAEDRGRHL